MMIGESRRHNPTVHVPPWETMDDLTDETYSPYPLTAAGVANCGDYNPLYLQEALSALQRYLPSNDTADMDSDDATDAAVDAYSCDQFRIYEFKVRRCVRGRSHDWTECPYAHPGEKARRRDPRKYHYSGTACPDFRKGSCKKGDSCEFAHGVFECWLHPARYRTQPCKDGLSCRRKVCFFAHSPEQLRVFSCQSPRSSNSGAGSFNESSLRQVMEGQAISFVSSPMISPPCTPTTESPPMSPMTHSLSRSLGPNTSSINEMVISLRNLQIGKMKSLPCSYNMQIGSPGYGSPRGSKFRPGFFSLPTTPTMNSGRGGIGYLDFCEEGLEEEPAMERVESGRDLRVRMFEKLSKENPLERVNPEEQLGGPDLDWVSELVK